MSVPEAAVNCLETGRDVAVPGCRDHGHIGNAELGGGCVAIQQASAADVARVAGCVIRKVREPGVARRAC